MMPNGLKLIAVAVLSLALSGVSGTVWAGGDASAGKAKAKSCLGCHPADGSEAKAPSLVGVDVGEFTEAMNAYRAGTKGSSAMKMFSKKLSDQDIADLAAYYESLE